MPYSPGTRNLFSVSLLLDQATTRSIQFCVFGFFFQHLPSSPCERTEPTFSLSWVNKDQKTPVPLDTSLQMTNETLFIMPHPTGTEQPKEPVIVLAFATMRYFLNWVPLWKLAKLCHLLCQIQNVLQEMSSITITYLDTSNKFPKLVASSDESVGALWKKCDLGFQREKSEFSLIRF